MYTATYETEANKLYMNNGADPPAFDEAGTANGVGWAQSSQAVACADYDDDGDVDIYLVNYAADGGPNKLYDNDGTGQFTDVAGTAGVKDDANPEECAQSGCRGYAVNWVEHVASRCKR